MVDETDFVGKARVAVGQELTVINRPGEFDFVEDFNAGRVGEKFFVNIFFGQQQRQKFFVHVHSSLINGIAQKSSVVGEKSFVAPQKFKQSVEEFLQVKRLPNFLAGKFYSRQEKSLHVMK